MSLEIGKKGPFVRRIAIIQSAYIPWRGFFDLIDRCEEFVILDGAQFVKGHWQNRNRIYTMSGVRWLSIPVATASRLGQAISDVEFSDATWADKHWAMIEAQYRTAPSFDVVAPRFRELYREASYQTRLTNVNEILLRGISEMVGIKTHFVRDEIYSPAGARTDRVVDICRKAGATHYLSGPSAKAYIEEEKFVDAGIELEWMTYPEYPAYPQLWGPFEPAVSIVDLLLNMGPDAAGLWRASTPSAS